MAVEMNQAEQAFELKEFAGLRNDVAPENFEAGDLSSALNVDIDSAKRIRRRAGFTEPTILGAYEWLYTDGERAFAVRGGTELVELTGTVTAYTTIRSDLTPGLRMVFTSPAKGFVYYSNGAQSGAFVNGFHRAWGLEAPVSNGVATLIGGELPVGRYQYLVTFVRATGHESGTRVPGVVEIATGQGFRLDGISDSPDQDVLAKKVYVSAPNGEALYWVGTIPANQTTFYYIGQLPHESVCQTFMMAPPPPSFELASFGAWLFTATDRAVRVSEPYQWELFDLRKGFNTGTRPLLLAAVNDGLYLGTESYIAWLPGNNPSAMEFKQIADYGVIPGTVSVGLAEQVGGGTGPAVVFASQKGVCVGMDGGQIKNVTRGRFAYPVQTRGASTVRTIRGVPQFVVTLQGTEEPSSEAYTEQT